MAELETTAGNRDQHGIPALSVLCWGPNVDIEAIFVLDRVRLVEEVVEQFRRRAQGCQESAKVIHEGYLGDITYG